MADAPMRHWRTAVGEIVGAWNEDEKSFGCRARIRTGRTTRRVLWNGPFRRTRPEARADLEGHHRRSDFKVMEAVS